MVFSSHNFETLKAVCDRIGIVAQGQIVHIIDMYNKIDRENLRQIVEKYRTK